MPLLNDEERWVFLEDLDEADFEVTSWEARFIESQLRFRDQALKKGQTRGFTYAQRGVIDRMHDSYARKL